jgi:Rrf2 family protein
MAKVVNISEAASIALHGMILIAKSKEMINVIAIAEATKTSKHHVAKILQRLVKEGYLESHRGPSGGFILKKDIKSINFLDIYEAIEGKIETNECPLDKQICPFNKCIMNNTTRKLTDEFRTYLKAQTLDKYL